MSGYAGSLKGPHDAPLLPPPVTWPGLADWTWESVWPETSLRCPVGGRALALTPGQSGALVQMMRSSSGTRSTSDREAREERDLESGGSEGQSQLGCLRAQQPWAKDFIHFFEPVSSPVWGPGFPQGH